RRSANGDWIDGPQPGDCDCAEWDDGGRVVDGGECFGTEGWDQACGELSRGSAGGAEAGGAGGGGGFGGVWEVFGVACRMVRKRSPSPSPPRRGKSKSRRHLLYEPCYIRRRSLR